MPDYVHHHDIRFQLIYCVSGWVRLVYEDQGEPFVMRAGDCVLQPPHIRHRVLECSDGFEVVEVASPAEHPTFVEHDMTLPTGASLPDRDFGGQRFVFHQVNTANWSERDGLQVRDIGLADATGGLVSAEVMRASVTSSIENENTHTFAFGYVLSGGMQLEWNGGNGRLQAGDAFTIPAGVTCEYQTVTDGVEFLLLRSA